jgi:hypothetical protein
MTAWYVLRSERLSERPWTSVTATPVERRLVRGQFCRDAQHGIPYNDVVGCNPWIESST